MKTLDQTILENLKSELYLAKCTNHLMRAGYLDLEIKKIVDRMQAKEENEPSKQTGKFE